MADDIDAVLASLWTQRFTGSDDPSVIEFAEQFGVDVAGMNDVQRAALTAALGARTFPTVVRIYLADFLPRASAGLRALGQVPTWDDGDPGESTVDPTDVLFNRLLPGIARLRDLDSVTTEVVRLRGASAHRCRLCRSLRDSTALDAGGSETLYDDIDRYETSALLSDAHKAALRYTDALIWSPDRVDPAVAAGVLDHFSAVQARELTLDVLRNASNKIAVSLAADAPRVLEGTELYRIGADGQPVYS